MKEICLEYFKDFACVGGKCTHNCCLLWEIDVDKKSLKFYKKASRKKNKYGTEFCDKLKNGIDYKNGSFIMQESNGKKRCPFLNGQNLCEIYLKLGKDKLCEICTNHPRFKNFFKDRLEWGVGLCCPESAKSVLSFNGKVGFIQKDDGKRPRKLNDFENQILSFRNDVLSVLQNSEKDINERFEKVFELCGVSICALKKVKWSDVFSRLEILDGSWKSVVKDIDIGKKVKAEFQTKAEQLAVYFVCRYLISAVDTLDLKSKTVFSVLFALIIPSLSKDIKELTENAIRYSTEIEYSQNNLSEILDAIDGVIVSNEKI